MLYCKHCIHFDVCKHHGNTVDFAVDDGVCLHFAKDTDVLTNADSIRAMSDGELAEFLCGVYDDDNCGVYQDECGKFINGTIIFDYDQHKIAEWLKQPAEGA